MIDRSADAKGPYLAGIADALLGGKNAYPADRAAAARLSQVAPEYFGLGQERANQDFLARAVRHLARLGIGQFIDFGTGFPPVHPIHAIARAERQGARVIYSDIDPLVVVHGDCLMAVDDGTLMVDADVRHPEELFDRPCVRALIDFSKPMAVLLTGVLQHISPAAAAQGILARVLRHLAPQSHVVITHPAFRNSLEPELRDIRQVLGTAGSFHPRSLGEVSALFRGLDLIGPGVVPTDVWSGDTEVPAIPAISGLPGWVGGVGRTSSQR